MLNNKIITIIDYGLGNLFSITNALNFLGIKSKIITHINNINEIDYLILPGVGAFPEAIFNLKKQALIEPIKEYCKTGKPLLGVCLGMQLLSTISEEYKDTEGLNLIPGKVVPIPHENNRVPHIAWQQLNFTQDINFLNNIPKDSFFYFVHSYHFKVNDPKHEIANCTYNNTKICSIIKKDNIIATQFHPEKSGKVGLRLLENILLEKTQ
jgi:glutamine amidotransferase